MANEININIQIIDNKYIIMKMEHWRVLIEELKRLNCTVDETGISCVKDQEKAGKLKWIVNYLVEENFSLEHLDAICHIVGLFNDCKESEAEIFKFEKEIYDRYAG